MSNSLNPDQARHFVAPDLGPKLFAKLSADDTSRRRVNLFENSSSSDAHPRSCNEYFRENKKISFSIQSPP